MNDSLPECTESFICVILRPSGESCIAIRDPDTITVVIEDDDGEYSSLHNIHVLPTEIVGIGQSIITSLLKTVTVRI